MLSKVVLKEINASLRNNIQCSFCSKTLTDPVSTLCDHQFCRKCILDFMKKTTQNSCPRCEATVTIEHLKTDKCFPQLSSLVDILVKEIDEEINRPVVSVNTTKRFDYVPREKISPQIINNDAEDVIDLVSTRKTEIRNSNTRGLQSGLSCKITDSVVSDASLRQNNGGGTLLTQLDREYRSKRNTILSPRESRTGIINKLYNYIVSEDLTGRNGGDERLIGTGTPDNGSVASSTEENEISFIPAGTDMSVDTKVHTWLENVEDETMIQEKDSPLKEKPSSASRPVQLQTAKRQSAIIAEHPPNVATTVHDEDPYEFIPSQHAVPLRKSRGRPRGKATRQTLRKGKVLGGKTNSAQKIVPISKAEAYDNIQLVESSQSENEDDMYRLFVTPSITVEEITAQREKKKTRSAPSKRKSVSNRREYEKEIKELANEIEDVENHELTVLTCKRRKINILNDKCDDGAGPSSKSDVTGMVKQNRCYFSPESSGNDIQSGAADFLAIDDSPNQLGNEDMPVVENKISDLEGGGDCVFTSHEGNNMEEIGEEIFTIKHTDSNVMVVDDFTSRLASHGKDQRENGLDSVRIPAESRNIFHSLKLDLCTKASSKVMSASEIGNTTTPTKVNVPNRIKSRISSFNKINAATSTPKKTNSSVSTPKKTNSSVSTSNKMNSRENTPNKTNSRENTPNKTNSRENTPNKTNSRENTPNKMNSRGNTPIKMRTAMNFFNSPTEHTDSELEHTSFCRNCGIAAASVVSLGVQTDFQFSPSTDVVMYPSFRVPVEVPKAKSSEDKINYGETFGSSDLGSDRLVIDEDRRASVRSETSGATSQISASAHTPPSNELNFDDYKAISSLREENIEMENETPEHEINVVENRSLSRMSDSPISQTQPLNTEQFYGSRTKRKRINEPENSDEDTDMSVEIDYQNDNECYMDEEDMFTSVGDKRNKFPSGQTSTPKSDSDESIINRPIRKGNTSRRLEDSSNDSDTSCPNRIGRFNEKRPKNIFETFSTKQRLSPPRTPEPIVDANDNSLLERSPARSETKQVGQRTRTRRGLANISNFFEEQLISPMCLEFGINKRHFGMVGGGSPQGGAKSKTSGNVDEFVVEQADSSSGDMILPTPDSKTKVGRSFTSVVELDEGDVDGRQKMVDDSGYGSTKKGVSAKRSLSNLLEQEKVKETEMEEEFALVEEEKDEEELTLVDEENVNECSVVSRESERERLRRKHQSFLEGPEESNEVECEVEKNMQRTPIGKIGTQTEKRATPKRDGLELTDSELLDVDLDFGNDGDREKEEEEMTTNYSPRKLDNLTGNQSIGELSMTQAMAKPSTRVQIVPEASTSGTRNGMERRSSIILKDRVAAPPREANINNSRQRKNVIEEPEEEERSLCFIASGLTSSEMKQVQDLANKFNGDFRLKWSDNTSHVIVKAGRDFITNRTLKYLEGIAWKRWIVSVDWVTDSLRNRQLINEERYEVVGDRVQGNHSGPSRSRLSNDLLLRNYEICCFGDFLEISKDDIIRLATACGASSVYSATMFSYKPGMIQLLLLQSIRRERVQDICNKYGVIAVVRDWLLDSISQYRILPMKTYPHLNPTV